MNTQIKKLLDEGKVDGFLAYKIVHGYPFPHLFTKENSRDLESWKATNARYPIVKLLLGKARANPDKTYGILVRGCEERAVNELFKWNQLKKDKVLMLGQTCTGDLAEECECWKPYPTQAGYGNPAPAVSESPTLKRLESMPEAERLAWWLGNFNRCLKCFGCRDVCPMCFCNDCSLEGEKLIAPKKLPPDTSFHLVRATHMAGRCIDCGLCEKVCPANIPLRALYKEANKLVEDTFGYKPGLDDGKSPFTFLGEESMLPPGPR